jgi:hypothetical protein
MTIMIFMSEENSKFLENKNKIASDSNPDDIDLEVMSAKIFNEQATSDEKAVLLIYKHNLCLDVGSNDLTALVIVSIEEKDDGSVQVDPLALVTTSKKHFSQLSGLINWIRI